MSLGHAISPLRPVQDFYALQELVGKGAFGQVHKAISLADKVGVQVSFMSGVHVHLPSLVRKRWQSNRFPNAPGSWKLRLGARPDLCHSTHVESHVEFQNISDL